MATDAAPPTAGVLPRQFDMRRQLFLLAAAATVSFTAVCAFIGFLGLLLLRASEVSLFAPFSGWQLYGVEVGLALAIMAVGAVAGRALVRGYRDLRGRTLYRRAAVMAALLPGLFAGGLAVTPMRAAFCWASEHTADGTAARHRYETWLNDYRKAPLTVPIHAAAAPAELAARMLRHHDLGADWYDESRPNPTVAPVPENASTLGGLDAARALLTREHWTGRSWSEEGFVAETAIKFASAADARSYLTVWLRPASSTAACCSEVYSGTTTRRIRQVIVWQRDATSRMGTTQGAAFVVGELFFTAILGPKPRTDAEVTAFEKVLSAAVDRAVLPG